jgi:hypothetical protein
MWGREKDKFSKNFTGARLFFLRPWQGLAQNYRLSMTMDLAKKVIRKTVLKNTFKQSNSGHL